MQVDIEKNLEELSDTEYNKIKDVVYEIALKRFNAGVNENLIKGLIHTCVGTGIYEANVCHTIGE